MSVTTRPRESRWLASTAALVALLLYVTLPPRLTIGPTWLMPLLEGALLVPLTITRPQRHRDESWMERLGAILLIVLINAANVASLVLLVHFLLMGGKANGRELIVAAVQIWLTNVLIFALWYWELDRGGPGERLKLEPPLPDFLFPQMIVRGGKSTGPQNWRPSFIDYLYTSFTNATAFSPTDTMPLTPRAKALMAAQSFASLLILGLIVARAVNILT